MTCLWILDSGVGDDEKMNNYMPMDRSPAILSLPIQQPHTGSNRKFSPGRCNQGINLKSGTSPSHSHSNYMEMNSPCGSSPMDTPGNYMPMSPGILSFSLCLHQSPKLSSGGPFLFSAVGMYHEKLLYLFYLYL